VTTLLKMQAVQQHLAAEKFEGDKQDIVLMVLEKT
jgi:hypothetical protein